MRTRLHTAPAILTSVLTLLLAAPESAQAADCGGDYLECRDRAGPLHSAESVYDTECLGAYLDCMSRQMLAY